MKPIELSSLIKGLMVIIGIALAAGKLDQLRHWAIKEAFPKSLQTTPRHDGHVKGIGYSKGIDRPCTN